MVKRILAIPNPRTNILLLTSLLLGVNALGTSNAGTTIVLTGIHKVSGQPTALKATRQALKVPVELYWCSIVARDVVANVSPSPNIHLKLTALGEDKLVKKLEVFSTGTVGV
jgi:hypothetical protein